jgi:4-diphosphocytidyl-2-C-methyl-D-erythritol kinase
VAPDVHSGTAEAYRDLSPRLTTIPLQNKLFSFQQDVWGAALSTANLSVLNDFQDGVFARHPELSAIANRLIRAGAHPVAMTGSGSSVFGIFSDRERLLRTRKSFGGERTFPISFVSRSQYRSAWRRALIQHTKGDQWPPRSRYAR